ncbi:alpha-ribazole phosphatase [Thiothrix eikelboomii]|uniref:Alpha-ribazole phosphatase n=1 Tax=Thiothrix eikelboomii TaxID=92487 RepID=A0A1T4VSA0_9GAMM|nr:histidine phosphatase family protein [Thiothrix eikelboomii]SKA67725.1 alpha-ribazole phosphatase [Thiothrix eikelboomii]
MAEEQTPEVQGSEPLLLPKQAEQPALASSALEQPPAQSTFIDLLKHGRVATPSLFAAPADEPLGMEGWKQLTLATQQGSWDVIYSSTTRRCHDFARLLAQRLDCEFIPDARLCELNFGAWIGLTQEEIYARDPELLHQYYFQPRRFIAPEGESMDFFMWRVAEFWAEVLEAQQGKRVLILTHTGVIRALIAKALDLLYQKSLRFAVDSACFTRLQIYPDGELMLLAHGVKAV